MLADSKFSNFSPEWVRLTIEDLLHNPSAGQVWLIAADSETIGYIVMSLDFSLEYRGKNAWVEEFYIRGTHRGQGIGGKALDFSLSRHSNSGQRQCTSK